MSKLALGLGVAAVAVGGYLLLRSRKAGAATRSDIPDAESAGGGGGVGSKVCQLGATGVATYYGGPAAGAATYKASGGVCEELGPYIEQGGKSAFTAIKNAPGVLLGAGESAVNALGGLAGAAKSNPLIFPPVYVTNKLYEGGKKALDWVF